MFTRVTLKNNKSCFPALPALHPVYSIPTEPNGANHTPQFANSAKTHEAHEVTLKVAAGLAVVGYKVLQDEVFAREVNADKSMLHLRHVADPELG